MGYWGWRPYVPVAKRRRKTARTIAKAKKAGVALSPVTLASRGVIAKTFWGKAWCDNLEAYSDYSNRLPRGRTYVRNGSVIDLNIEAGKVKAQVMGSRLYRVEVNVAAVPARQWKDITRSCTGSIASLVELLQGKLSKAVMERICRPRIGLFPVPREIRFDCSCPDWASMCKHVAAVLYGVGARLDQQPELLFTLRRADANALVAQAGVDLPAKARKVPGKTRVLDDAALTDVFGIEMAGAMEAKPPGKPGPRRKTAVAPLGKSATSRAKRTAAGSAAKSTAKPVAAKKTVKSGTSSAVTKRTVRLPG